MPTLRRHDGSQFIIQSYRELLAPDRTSVLKRHIRTLAQKQGNNVRLFKHTDSDMIEAVFSREAGFLLGETLWYFLNKPKNLIYCEALPERRQGLLVIIRNNVVYVDTRMSFTSLVDEFMSISASDEKFDIYTWGDTPLSQDAEGGKFAFAPKNVASFQTLEEPLLEKLPINDAAQLQPLEIALSSPYLGKSKLIPILIATGTVIVLLIVWHVLHQAATLTPPNLNLPIHRVSPYQQFYRELSTPMPREQIEEFAAIADLTETVPGWEVMKISYTNGIYSCTMQTDEGKLLPMQNWAQANNFGFTAQDGGVVLTIPSNLKNRPRPTAIYNTNDLLSVLSDDLSMLTSSKSITFTPPIAQGSYKVATMNIKLNHAQVGKLLIIGEELSRMPVTITSIIMSVTKNNAFSGDITLKVLGD